MKIDAEPSTSTSNSNIRSPSKSPARKIARIQDHFSCTKAKQTSVTSFFMKKKMPLSVKKNIDEELLNLFTMDYQPFSIVNDVGFRNFVSALNPAYTLPNRQTISKSLIPLAYEKCLNSCKEKVKNITHACLTTDCWTSLNNESFIGVTIHYINENFELKSVLLKCSSLMVSHTAENLAQDINNCLEEWDLKGKIGIAVSDNAANITKAFEILRFRRFGCFAHTINLVVIDALKDIEKTVDKVKQIVGHFRRSTATNGKFINYQKNNGAEPKKLIQDVVTRWNSTFYMLDRFVELENAVRATMGIINANLPVIALEEWELIKNVIVILKPFERVTKVVSGENYMTGSLVIVMLNGLLTFIEESLKKMEKTSGRFNMLINTENKGKDIIKNMLLKMQGQLLERFKNIEKSTSLAICTFLDPRFKTYAFRDDKAAEEIKKIVINMVSEKIAQRSNVVTVVTEEKADLADDDHRKPDDNDEFSIWSCVEKKIACSKVPGTASSRAIMEVQRYMEDVVLERTQDPFQWWRENSYMFPNLATIFKEKCCALATSVPCERLFSKAGQILSERRTRLSAKNVERILFLNANSK